MRRRHTLAATLAALGLAAGLGLAAAPEAELATGIDIAAPPETVWALLADPAAHVAWNPMVLAMEGDLATGARFRMTLATGATGSVTFRPEVVHHSPGRELCWLGRLGAPRLLDGLHCWRIEANATGTRLTNAESFRGVLLWAMDAQTFRDGFEAANLGLKAAAEARAEAERG